MGCCGLEGVIQRALLVASLARREPKPWSARPGVRADVRTRGLSGLETVRPVLRTAAASACSSPWTTLGNPAD